MFDPGSRPDPVAVARAAAEQARLTGRDTVIYDTAGRLHIDDELMDQVARLKEAIAPQETLFVADAMTGQDAVRSAAAFHARLDATGVIFTKTDGDSRGGAALSIVSTIHRPIKFVGTGEKIEGPEPFHPDRMASRILGMGDVPCSSRRSGSRSTPKTRRGSREKWQARESSPSRTCAIS